MLATRMSLFFLFFVVLAANSVFAEGNMEVPDLSPPGNIAGAPPPVFFPPDVPTYEEVKTSLKKEIAKVQKRAVKRQRIKVDDTLNKLIKALTVCAENDNKLYKGKKNAFHNQKKAVRQQNGEKLEKCLNTALTEFGGHYAKVLFPNKKIDLCE